MEMIVVFEMEFLVGFQIHDFVVDIANLRVDIVVRFDFDIG